MGAIGACDFAKARVDLFGFFPDCPSAFKIGVHDFRGSTGLFRYEMISCTFWLFLSTWPSNPDLFPLPVCFYTLSSYVFFLTLLEILRLDPIFF